MLTREQLLLKLKLLITQAEAPPVIDEEPAPSIPRTVIRGVQHEYSTINPFDHKNRAVIVQHPSDGTLYLYTLGGELYITFPSQINSSSQPHWLKHKPDCFVYRYQNELREFDCASQTIRVVRRFDLPDINGMGESDISEDGDHLVLCSGDQVFVYQLSTDRVTSQFRAPGGFDNLQVSPDNEPIISLYDQGVKIYRGDRLQHLAPKLGHMDVGRDTNGEPILLWCNAADASVNNNGIEKIRLADGKRTLLGAFDWSYAMHVSAGPSDFCLVSIFQPGINGKAEILRVRLDGSHVDVLSTLQGDFSKYDLQPRASLSADASRYIYDFEGDSYIVAL